MRRSLEKEEDALTKEYQGLTSGKVMELPEELERELETQQEEKDEIVAKARKEDE